MDERALTLGPEELEALRVSADAARRSYRFWFGPDAACPHPDKDGDGALDADSPAAPTGCVTRRSCEVLGWNAAAYGDTDVCGASVMPLLDSGGGAVPAARDRCGNGCFASASYPEAEASCAAGGARLCTYAELLANETKGTGCGFDSRRVWTSTNAGCPVSTAIALVPQDT